jgi:hypothetical protein
VLKVAKCRDWCGKRESKCDGREMGGEGILLYGTLGAVERSMFDVRVLVLGSSR